MPSPFPGMNPFLEQETVWPDFHERFCPLVAELLTAQVRPHYIVKIDEHIYIHEMPEASRQFLGRADVGLMHSRKQTGSTASTAVLEAPAQVRLPAVDLERLSFVEIRDRLSRQLITVIELLSPSNKFPGPDREQYIAKRAQILASSVHFVEIDLLRGGPRLPLEDLAPCSYYALVSRVEDRPKAGSWPIALKDPLPKIPIPLQTPHPDAQLDLQQVLHRLYDAAGYEDYIYQDQPQPPLGPEDTAWASQFVPKNLQS
jgi:hypothetical protein